MIKRILEWLKSLYYIPASKADTQSLGVNMPDPVVDQTSQAVTEVVAASPLADAKAKFEAFIQFVEHGIEVLGADAEADLVAFKDKYL